jgi:hypothetical protein
MAVVDDFDLDSVNNAVNSAFGRKSAPPARTQSSRDQEALRVLQDEYEKQSKLAAGGNAASARNLEALQREMKLKGGAPTTAQTPSDDFSVDAIGAAVQDAFKTEQKKKKFDVPLMASQLYNKTQETKKDFGASLASLADTTIGGVLPMTGQVVQAASRPFTTPEKAQQYGQAVTTALENPFGKTFGVTESPAYKGEASRKIMEFIGENINKGAEWIAQKTGLPLPDVQNMMGTATIAAPAVLAKPLATVAKPLVKGAETLSQWGNEIRSVAPSQLEQQFQAKGGKQSVGAAAAMPENVLRGNIDAAIAQSSPELQAHVKTLNPRAVDLPSLETRSLEDRHGINLTTGQRTGDTSLYSQEWNKRGETSTLGEHFNEQPKQFKAAFENSIRRNSPDINEIDPSAIGQVQINALAAKDQIRKTAISEAYKALEDANGGQFPIDISKLKANIDNELKSKLKYNAYEDKLGTIKKDIDSLIEKGNMTFSDFENLRTNLADELRSNGNGTARQAAYIVRDQLEKLPIFGEETGSAQAIQLKALADKARSLNKERMDVIKSNPAYKSAVKESSTLEDAASQGESLNAEKFHDKFVTKGTPESIRRMKAELADDPQAIQAMVAGELRQAMRKAGLATDTPDLNPKQLANYIYDNRGRLQEALGPEGMKDLMELTALSSKVGMPKTGTFNYSNSFSSMLGELVKQGIATGAETKLATMTGGASIPAMSLGKEWMGKLNKEGFARQAVNPYGGLTKDLNVPQKPVKIDLSGMAKKE